MKGELLKKGRMLRKRGRERMKLVGVGVGTLKCHRKSRERWHGGTGELHGILGFILKFRL